VADARLTTGPGGPGGALRRGPAAVCVALTALAVVISWRRFLGGQHSPFTSDIEQYHHPVTRELARAWSEGRIPLWTDHVYFGFPFFADPQTAAWYPGTLLVATLGPHRGYVLFLLLHSLVAALGTTGLVRSHGGAWSAAWASGLMVALSGYFAHEAQHPGLFAILAWIPTWLWTTHAVFLRPSPPRVAAAAVAAALLVLPGTLQVLFGAVIVYACYVASLCVDTLRERGRRAALTGLATTLGAQLLGLCLTAVVWLPALAHLPRTARALGMTYDFASMGSLHPLQLLGVFVRSAATSLAGGAELGFGGASFYMGALTLALAGVGLASARRALPLALGAASAVIALLALGRHGWLYPLLFGWAPGAAGTLRGVGRAMGPGSVGLALLAGLGLQRLGRPDARILRLLGVLLVASLACHGLVLAARPGPTRNPALYSAIVLALALGVWAVGRRQPRVLRLGLAVLVALDLVCFGALDGVLRATPSPPNAERLAGDLPVLTEIAQGRAGDRDARILLFDVGPRNLPLLVGLDGAGGYNPLIELQTLDFANLVNRSSLRPRAPLDRFVHGAQPMRFGTALFDAAAIRTVISHRALAGPGLRPVRRDPPTLRQPRPVHLYEYERALPRAYLAYRGVPASSADELPRLLGSEFNGREATVAEGLKRRLDGPARIEPVERHSERPERLRFEVAPEQPALLVVTDSWDPGWRAWVDGEEAPVLRVNGLFRGVPVGAGAHRVDMRFEPWSFRVGGALSAAAAAVLGAWGLAVGAASLRRSWLARQSARGCATSAPASRASRAARSSAWRSEVSG